MQIKHLTDPIQKGMCQASIILGVVAIAFSLVNSLLTAVLSIEGMMIACFSRNEISWLVNIAAFLSAVILYML